MDLICRIIYLDNHANHGYPDSDGDMKECKIGKVDTPSV